MNQSAPQISPYDEDEYDGGSPDSYDYDDDVKPYADEKATRYGRGITESPPRGRSGSGSGSGREMGLGIRGADYEHTPPRPPAHRGDSGTSGNGSGAGARETPRNAFL